MALRAALELGRIFEGMRGWLFVSAAFATLSASAVGCGGESEGKEMFEDAPGPGGAAGSDSASGGSPGLAGSAEQTAGRAAGGSATFGGMSSGAGRGGSSAGGAGGSSAGASSAGRASVGGASVAGSGGSSNVIPPEFEDRCKANCASAAQARCPNSPAQRECVQQCRLTTQRPECVSAVEALFDCVEAGMFECNEEGEASVPGCERAATAATLCVLGNASDPELREPCETYCADASIAECPNAESESDCVLGCQLAGGLLTECGMSWRDYLTCSEGASFYCGDDGKPVAEGCESKFLLFAACYAEATS
jgi:hypothetical protein